MIDALEQVLRRPRTIFTLMLAMIGAGIVAYISIPKEAQPDIDVPVFYVSVPQQGISPEDAERLLVRPMETQLRGLDGLKELTAIAGEGHAGIVLEFSADFDKDEALNDIRDKVDKAKAELPADADEPTISETNFSLIPTIIITLSGNVPERTLYRSARKLKDQIEAISTVLEANLSGQREELLEVIIDSTKLESYGVTQTELINAVTSNNQLIAAGFRDNGKGRFNVKVPGLLETAKDVFTLPIKQSGDGVVTLEDVAEIRRTFKDPSRYTRVNGQPAIAIEVTKRIGTNIIENNKAVRAIVADFTKTWPKAIQINYLLDQSNFIGEVQGSLQSSIMTAIFLVMILVVAVLGLRSSLLVGLAIPTSFMIGFLTLSFLGMTVNMMVMFGLVLTVGMLVDGAIVMVEYADRRIAEGQKTQEAYIEAARMMFWPIVSSTATTLAAFLPMLLWPGVPGEFMSYLPIMVIIVLTASLLTAMVFLPVTGTLMGALFAFVGRFAAYILTFLIAGLSSLAFRFVAIEPVNNLSVLSEFDGDQISAMVMGIAVLIGLIVFVLSIRLLRPLVARRREAAARAAAEKYLNDDDAREFDIKRYSGAGWLYLQILRLLAMNPFGTIVTLVAIVGIAFTIFITFAANNNGVEFFVDEEPDQFVVMVSARGNMSVDEARELVMEVEDEVMQVRGIKDIVVSAFASGGGSGPQFIGGIQDKPADLIGEFNVELANYCCRRKFVEIADEIRKRTQNFAGLKVEIRKIEGGPPTGKDVRLEIKSTNYETLRKITSQIRTHFESVENLRDLEDDRPLPGIEWQLTIDREEAGRFNTSIAAVGAMVQLVTNGVRIGSYRPDDTEDEVDIRARLPESERTLDRFEQLRIRTPNGLVPLANFVSRKPQAKVSSITRKDGLYTMNVKANVVQEAGVLPDDKVKEIQTWLDGQTWPDTVFFAFRGADEEQKESGEFLMKAMAGSLFLMFIILVTQYNSFYQTILTLATVVLSVFGVLLGMMITGQKFSIIMTGTGIVALAGIVVNNAIVLIDTYNRMLKDGVDPLDAVLLTAGQRIRPILLTTITTIAGLIPMATQVNFDFFAPAIAVGGITAIWWIQLSTAVISGLAFSTILTLIVIPVMLAAPHVWIRSGLRVGGYFARRREVKEAKRLAKIKELEEKAAKEAEAKPDIDDAPPKLTPVPDAAE